MCIKSNLETMNRPENDRQSGNVTGLTAVNNGTVPIRWPLANSKPGFGTFQNRKPGFGKDGRVCKPYSGGCWLPVNMAQNQPLWRLLAMSGVMHSCGASQKWWWWWCLKKLILLLVISVIFHWKPPTSKTDIWATHKLLVCFDFWGTFNLFLTSCSFPITKAK